MQDVAGWADLDDVLDPHVLARDAEGREVLPEEAPARADEGEAQALLVSAGSLTNNDNLGAQGPRAGDAPPEVSAEGRAHHSHRL